MILPVKYHLCKMTYLRTNFCVVSPLLSDINASPLFNDGRRARFIMTVLYDCMLCKLYNECNYFKDVRIFVI